MTNLPVPPQFTPVEIPSKYSKAIVAILFAVLTVFITALSDNHLDPVDLVNVAIAFLSAILVYAIPNIKDQTVGTYAKVIIAFLGTALQAVLPFIINGDVTTQQWLIVLLSAIGALGVGVIPNVNPELVAAQTTVVNTATIQEVAGKHVATGGTYNVTGGEAAPAGGSPTFNAGGPVS